MDKIYDGQFWKYVIYAEHCSYEYLLPYIKLAVNVHRLAENEIIPDAPHISIEIGFGHWYITLCYCESYEPEYVTFYDTFRRPDNDEN